MQILEAIAAIDVDCHPELCCVRTTRFIISLSPWTSRSHSLTFSSSGGGEGGGGEAWVERSPSSPSRFRKETLEVSLLPRDITLRRPSRGGEGNSLGRGTRAGEGVLAGGIFSISRFPCCISFIFVALIFVLKYSRRWRPPIGGCKKFEPPFRPEMSNLIHFFCTIPLPHTCCPTKTRFYPLWSTPEPPGASSLGPVGRCSSLQTSCLK